MLAHPVIKSNGDKVEYYTKRLAKDRKTGQKCILKTIDGTSYFERIPPIEVNYQSPISCSAEITRSASSYRSERFNVFFIFFII